MKTARNFGLAVVAGLALVVGAAWRGGAPVDAAQPVAAHTAPATPSIQHAVAGGRDSYADVVRAVSPAVVTIRVEGRAKCRRPSSRDRLPAPTTSLGDFSAISSARAISLIAAAG